MQKQKLENNLSVNYLKLGESGCEASRCLGEGVAYIGFGTEEKEFFDACHKRDWKRVKDIVKHRINSNPSTVTNITNQLKRFFEDDGTSIWITFEDQKLWWTHLKPDSEFISEDNLEGKKVYKEVIGGWSDENIKGEKLNIFDLAGDVTQTQYYRGTSRNFDNDVHRAEYLITKINGEETQEVIDAKGQKNILKEYLNPLIKKLHWKDFELLVELIFAHSGWRRITSTGGTEKFHDGIMEQTAINEKAALQVKSKTNEKELEGYLKSFHSSDLPFSRFYFVYHTGTLKNYPREYSLGTQNKTAYLWNIYDVSEGVLQAGLVDWLIKRAR